MVRAVCGEQTYVEEYVDSVLQSGVTLQFGLAIGRLSSGSGRDVIFSLIPTPKNEGGDVARFEGEPPREIDKKKGIKGKSVTQTLQIDIDWVAEHARQVSKMLVGGIRVLGCFILASESVFKASAPLLWQTSKMVALALDEGSSKAALDDLLLLHFSFGPRRTLCRNCSFESGYGSSSIRPCEWKAAKMFSNLHCISCMYNFDCRVPIYANESSKQQLLDILLSAIAVEARLIESAVVLSDGCLVGEDKALIGDVDHKVDLLLPFESSRDYKNGAVTGLAMLSGSIQACAYGFSRDPWTRVIADLKADIIKSMKSRLEILRDEIDGMLQDQKVTAGGESSLNPLRQTENNAEFRYKLPRRLFFPWLEGVFLCDYLQEGESLQDVSGRIKELLNVDKSLQESEILEYEQDGAVKARSFWDVTAGIADTDEKSKQKVLNTSVVVSKNFVAIGVLSFLVLVLSVLATYFLGIRRILKG
ncbi:hypothetical protein KP509_25G007700 [Ceratopteris richardii]|uniref:Protein odr-4 homolog n=3 Tax=Ceratopteris richardii TaxID=49495 RepID=A0A8T2RQH9_CERRI|nr:hypothetical protein KP509_25G007700 [Ceratopteris richardii]